MEATKTTFHLPDTLRERLKVLAARRGVTVTDLLTQGASLVLTRYQGSLDREDLQKRAAAARQRLRDGLYGGPPLADTVDEAIYGAKEKRSARRAKR
ncbi:MAG: hypothetical protein HYY06_01840 [Deltaproteobacteria bacterium]|nr:hypothetical protein [Deltaproteobacteria bacterium]